MTKHFGLSNVRAIGTELLNWAWLCARCAGYWPNIDTISSFKWKPQRCVCDSQTHFG